ncbi:MAG: hypothetical protein ACI8P9_001623 [Parasphingorhabdus sp.]|jgi:uncharacterized protein (DUF2132 family)
MNDEINYKVNPLHGVSLKKLLIELVTYYGFDILFAYLNINCFKTNPSIESSVKFLKKTDWAREKVEAFYLYKFKNLPRASEEQFQLSPRDRIVPEDQIAGEPAELSLEDAERLREKRVKKSTEYLSGSASYYDGLENGRPSNSRDNDRTRKDSRRSANSSRASAATDPWAKWREKANQQKT